MIKIQRLKRPTKRSGFALKPKGVTKIRGLVITNQNEFVVWVDKWKRRSKKK